MSRTIIKICRRCNKEFSIPRSREWREHCCSPACKKLLHEAQSKEKIAIRKRACLACGTEFIPRPYQLKIGQGRFCSRPCAHPFMVASAHTEEANSKRTTSHQVRAAREDCVYKSGPDHPQWKGGRGEAAKRRSQSGKANESLRKYRAENPEKAREWHLNRLRKKKGRIEYGSLPKLFKLQKGKCAICTVVLPSNYHVDHIMPIAKGGLNEKYNIQLLCPTCNVRKSAKDPIKYAQERGMLL